VGEIAGALFTVLIFGIPAFALASFTGGFAGAIAAGGREDRSHAQNAVIGFLAWLIANALVGGWGEEPTARLLVLTLVAAVIIAWLDDHRKSRRDTAVLNLPV
jgi:peptidoglycan/LPS O-acetylase OafA/YrhL